MKRISTPSISVVNCGSAFSRASQRREWAGVTDGADRLGAR
jgi:hypothetical protein